MDRIKLLARNGEAVRQALELGEILHLDTASEEVTDEFLLFAIRSGLLKTWAEGFPDPRQWSEISLEVILAASLAARFAKLYSLRKTGYVLRSARVRGPRWATPSRWLKQAMASRLAAHGMIRC